MAAEISSASSSLSKDYSLAIYGLPICSASAAEIVAGALQADHEAVPDDLVDGGAKIVAELGQGSLFDEPGESKRWHRVHAAPASGRGGCSFDIGPVRWRGEGEFPGIGLNRSAVTSLRPLPELSCLGS